MSTVRVPIWCEIVCRVCASTIARQFSYGQTPRTAMKREALNAGWQLKVFDREDIDWICRKCLTRKL